MTTTTVKMKVIVLLSIQEIQDVAVLQGIMASDAATVNINAIFIIVFETTNSIISEIF